MIKINRYRCLKVIMLLVAYSVAGSILAQKNYQLRINYLDSNIERSREKAGIITSFNSKFECDGYLVKLLPLLQSKGFISASLDTISHAEKEAVVDLFLGSQYQSLKLNIRDQDKAWIVGASINENSRTNGIFNFSAYTEIVEKLLDHFETTGYPFAKINLDSVQIQGNRINALLNIDKGFPYVVDSIRMFGPAKISRNFMHHYLNIEQASAYNKKKLDKINQRLLELPYVEQTRPWDVTMLRSGSIVNLYLQPRRSNQINVLAGFLPANQQLGGKLLLTIDANLHLQNAFGSGEAVSLLWQQIQPKSPRLNLQFTQPYIFNSSFGLDLLFDLLKKDSAFLNITAQIGLLYFISPTQTGKVFIQTRRTNILDTDTILLKATRKLPDVADVSSVNLAVDYTYYNTDYKFNPRRGNDLFFSALVGNKTIKKNNAISQLKDVAFDYNSLYDSVKLNTYQLKLILNFSRYFKAGKQTVLKTALNTGAYISPQYYRNDLFQIGGYKLLRGFDEESIYANRYAIGTLEYRYLLGLNSNFFIFTDGGFSSNDIFKQSNSYLGAGVGLSFETKKGIFNLSYAAGKRNDLDFDIKQAKIHFGFVSIF